MNRKSPTILSIKNPCSESWEKMTERGNCSRYCNLCEKHVTDFSNQTDREILNFLAENKESKICGRFSETQLNRPLITFEYEERGKPLWLKIGLALLVLLGIREANAQDFPSKEKVELVRDSIAEVQLNATTDSLRIRGVVRDRDSGEPIPFVKIYDAIKHHGTISDIDGTYSLSLPRLVDQDTLNLTVNSIEFGIKEFRIPIPTDTKPQPEIVFDIVLEPVEVQFIGEIALVPEPIHYVGGISISKKQIRRSRRAWRKANRNSIKSND